jgi:hypothetical protein
MRFIHGNFVDVRNLSALNLSQLELEVHNNLVQNSWRFYQGIASSLTA